MAISITTPRRKTPSYATAGIRFLAMFYMVTVVAEETAVPHSVSRASASKQIQSIVWFARQSVCEMGIRCSKE